MIHGNPVRYKMSLICFTITYRLTVEIRRLKCSLSEHLTSDAGGFGLEELGSTQH